MPDYLFMPWYSWNTAKVGVKHQSININEFFLYVPINFSLFGMPTVYCCLFIFSSLTHNILNFKSSYNGIFFVDCIWNFLLALMVSEIESKLKGTKNQNFYFKSDLYTFFFQWIPQTNYCLTSLDRFAKDQSSQCLIVI